MNLPLEMQEELVRLTQHEVEKATKRGDGPFAALLVDENGKVVESATNTTRTTNNVAAHAEINLLGKVNSRDLSSYAVVTNAAPCSMCMSALIKAKVQNYYYGAFNEPHNDPAITPEEVAAKSKLGIHIFGGILADECAEQIIRGRQKLNEKAT